MNPLFLFTLCVVGDKKKKKHHYPTRPYKKGNKREKIQREIFFSFFLPSSAFHYLFHILLYPYKLAKRYPR